VKIDPEAAARAVDKHRFQKHKKTGTLQFRRHGEAGVWRKSGNFSPEVLQVAQEILGPLRGRLGYGDV